MPMSCDPHCIVWLVDMYNLVDTVISCKCLLKSEMDKKDKNIERNITKKKIQHENVTCPVNDLCNMSSIVLLDKTLN